MSEQLANLGHYLSAHWDIAHRRVHAFALARDYQANGLVVPHGFAPVVKAFYVVVCRTPLALVSARITDDTGELPRPIFSYTTPLSRRQELVVLREESDHGFR